jgi:D-xylose transport system substrate-binding protein
MLRRAIPLVLLAAAGIAACGGNDNSSGSSGASGSSGSTTKASKVAVLLPDTQSSVRYEEFDRPLLTKAFKAAGVPVQVSNAQGDTQTQRTQADQAMTNGAKVILLDALDSGTGAAIEADANSKGVKVIDYDRLVLNGTADYYVSFDNTAVGRLQGQGLVSCLGTKSGGVPIAILNGSPTDNNATLFKQGAHQILDPKFQDGTYKKVAEQAVPDWDNQQALTIFEQMLQKTNNKIDGVLAANDGLVNAAISALKVRRLAQIPITGQDATLQGIQNIVTGDQCMTVYKPVAQEVTAAAKLATALAKGQTPTGVTASTDNGSKKVPSILLKPISVTKDNIKRYFGRADFPTHAQVCAGKVASVCTKAGL